MCWRHVIVAYFSIVSDEAHDLINRFKEMNKQSKPEQFLICV